MKRRVLGLLLTGLSLFAAAGCASVEVEITVHQNSTADFMAIISYPKELYGALGEEANQDVCEYLEKQNQGGFGLSELVVSTWEETETHCVNRATLSGIPFDEGGLQIPESELWLFLVTDFSLKKTADGPELRISAEKVISHVPLPGSSEEVDPYRAELMLRGIFPNGVEDHHGGTLSADGESVSWNLTDMESAAAAKEFLLAHGRTFSPPILPLGEPEKLYGIFTLGFIVILGSVLALRLKDKKRLPLETSMILTAAEIEPETENEIIEHKTEVLAEVLPAKKVTPPMTVSSVDESSIELRSPFHRG